MTGIERLREWADGYAELGKDHTTIDVVPSGMATLLSSIADQIERERVSRMRVLSVVTEMERHILGHEGADDSPVARWARELREALGGDGRKPANYASISAYDLRPEEDREAIAWVRERGGLDAVKRRWECLSYYADPVPRSCMEKRLARLQRQIDESHAALRRRREVISELNRRACDLTRKNAELRKRAMPDGMEWPVFEDGEPVRIGSDFGYGVKLDSCEVTSILFTSEGCFLEPDYSWEGDDYALKVKQGERVKRPAPKVLDSEGVECNVGDAVWWVHNKTGNFRIIRIEQDGKCAIHDDDADEPCGMTVPSTELTHKRPVLDADGAEIRVGDTVYDNELGIKATVTFVHEGIIDPDFPDHVIRCKLDDDKDYDSHMFKPSQLTHRAPVLAADGKPLREGETVWDENGDELVIGAIEDGGHTVTCRYADVGDAIPVHGMWSPSQLTHTKPEIDTWERIEEEARSCTCVMEAIDLVRRAKKLAGVSE